MASGTLLALRWATNSEAPGLDLQVGSKEGRWASSSATNSLQRLGWTRIKGELELVEDNNNNGNMEWYQG